jgi:hypothetical protein
MILIDVFTKTEAWVSIRRTVRPESARLMGGVSPRQCDRVVTVTPNKACSIGVIIAVLVVTGLN